MQLRPGLRVLRRAHDEVQVGTDPRWAVRVTGLAPEQVDALLAPGGRALDGRLPGVVLDRLGVAGLLRAPTRPSRLVVPALAPEVVGHGLARADGDVVAALRRRSAAVVSVAGLDRVGLGVAVTLAASGVGCLHLDDDRPVRPEDVCGGLTADDVGRPRAHAAADALARAAPRVRVRREQGGRAPDVVVTAATDAVDPVAALALVAADVPHLPVVSREADCVVGPFVAPPVPGPAQRQPPAPCLRCLDLHRAAADPAWPTVLAQLTAPHRPPVTGPTAAVAAVAAGLAAAEVLAHLDGDRPRTVGAQYEVPVPDAVPRRRVWAAHPECGCAALV